MPPARETIWIIELALFHDLGRGDGFTLIFGACWRVLGLKSRNYRGQRAHQILLFALYADQNNGHRTRNRPFHAPEKWAAFKRYNLRIWRDGRSAERAAFPYQSKSGGISASTREINDRGVRIV